MAWLTAPRRGSQQPGQVGLGDLRAPHGHRGEEVAGGLVQLAQVGADALVQAGGPRASSNLASTSRGRSRPARRRPDRSAVARRGTAGGPPPPRGPAAGRAGPAARLVEHQALGHHPAHRRERQPGRGLLVGTASGSGRSLAAGDQDRERQAAAGPGQSPEQAQGGRVQELGVVGPQHHRPVARGLSTRSNAASPAVAGSGLSVSKAPAAASGSRRRPCSAVRWMVRAAPGGSEAKIFRARKVLPMPTAPSMTRLAPGGVPRRTVPRTTLVSRLFCASPVCASPVWADPVDHVTRMITSRPAKTGLITASNA